ncbi:MAG TPA: phytoene desaturase family protein [Candidatus Dojkabacteria bacterium]|nr:phytoene desaturase family protein [Candidatus Dojkabacteria bacterium]HRO65079.1 phytoene desaturase family protein [Candidatus Dojkabacteria bacterium]HRP51691.1 phytoene desaturase family protein [Candidatus Dojkabacteria bacterium]
MKKVAIIGSGFGGLALAVRLQGQGYKVTVFEKQDKVGGHAYQLKKDGYTFDMGPSLITATEIIDDVFKSAGEEREKYLGYIPLDPYYRIYFHDKTFIDYNGDSDAMKSQLAKFNKDDAKAYDKFMEYSSKLYKIVISDRMGSQPFLSMKDFFKAAPKIISTKSMLSCYTNVKFFFKDFRSRFIFSFHPLFIGGSPFNSPSLYLMIPYLEKVGGVWFTKGGMYSLIEALEKVFKKHGGIVNTSTEVYKIIIEDGKAVGVKTKNGEEKFDLVVSNAHFAHTYKDLIEQDKLNKWKKDNVNKMKYSMSCYLAYIGTKKQYPELKHHTLILSERYKGLIDDIFKNKVLADDFSMYLHVPTKTDSSMAPKGCESMYVLIPTPNLKADVDWKVEKDRFTKRVLDFLENDFGMKDLQKNIDFLEVFTPMDFLSERNNYLGSAWGVQPTLFQSANFRPHNRSEDVENLYLVGASTHPGAGVPGVLLTAETTEKLIVKDHPV